MAVSHCGSSSGETRRKEEVGNGKKKKPQKKEKWKTGSELPLHSLGEAGRKTRKIGKTAGERERGRQVRDYANGRKVKQ
jgi:hypothetical protein